MSVIEIESVPIYCTIIAGVMSHLFLLICLAKDPLNCFRNSASYLVSNLALADFIVCTINLMTDMIFVDKFFTIFMCTSATAALVSLFSIFSIAVDRYVLTVHPFIHRVHVNGRRIAIWIVLVWVLSLYFAIKVSIFGPSNTDAIIYFTIFITFASLTGLIYLVTFFSLRKQQRNITQHCRQGRNQTLQQEFLKTIIIVAFIQIFTLLPTTIAGLINILLILDADSSIVGKILYQLYLLNFAINPCVYMWRLKNYRRTFCLVVNRKTR